MLPDFFRALIQAYLAPQASARSVMASGAGFREALLLILLSYLLTNIVLMLTPGVDPQSDMGTLDRHVFGIISTLISFFAISALIYFFGKVSGGTATREETYLVVAWHSVVTSILAGPVNLMMSGFEFEEKNGTASMSQAPDSGTIALAVAAIVLWCWLLAHFITAVHRFHNFWGVAAVVMGLPVGLAFLLVNLAGAVSAISSQGLAQ